MGGTILPSLLSLHKTLIVVTVPREDFLELHPIQADIDIVHGGPLSPRRCYEYLSEPVFLLFPFANFESLLETVQVLGHDFLYKTMGDIAYVCSSLLSSLLSQHCHVWASSIWVI